MALRLAFPLRVTTTGGLATLVQDSPREVAQSVALLLATRPGERRSVPDYGTPDPLFGGIDIEDITAAVEEWEERADPALVEVVATGMEEYATVQPADFDPDNEVFA
jgi:predicted component of type VI protein secretion system